MIRFFTCKNNKTDLKETLLKELFNSKKQRKNIIRAAKESSEDQKKILIKYQSRLIKN